MKPEAINQLRELHRLISRPCSVHACFSSTLEQAIKELSEPPMIVQIPKIYEGQQAEVIKRHIEKRE